MPHLGKFFKIQPKQEVIKSVLLIVCVAAIFLFISYQNRTHSTDEGIRHPNGEFRSENIGEKFGCPLNDSLSLSYEITPSFGLNGFKITMRIDSAGNKTGMVYSTAQYCNKSSNNVEFSQEDSIKIDSIPVAMLNLITNMTNNYVQDSTRYFVLDGDYKVLTLCDRKSGKETMLSIFDVEDAPHANAINDSLKKLILLSIPKSQHFGSAMRYYGTN